MIAGLPYDAEIEWIQTATNAYLNTGISAYKSSDSVRSLVQEFELTPIGYSSRSWFHGSNGWNFFGIRNGKWFYNSETRTVVNGVKYLVRAEVSNSSQSKRLYVNGELIDSGAGQAGNSNLYYICIGTIGNAGGGIAGSTYAGTWRVGRCRIEKSGVLVRDMIPVRVGQTGYMYDRVSRKLFGNKGTGAFVLGPDVARPIMGLRRMRKVYTADDYIKNGLIAMWDGIENAGWGKHDANAITWSSLVGNDSLSVVGGADGWGNEHFKLLGSNAHYASGEVSFRPDNISTWELCCLVRDTSIAGRFYGWNLPNGNINYCDHGLTSFDSTRHFYYRDSGISATASNLNRINPPLGEVVTSALVMSGGATSVTLSGIQVLSVSGTPGARAGLIFAIGGGSDGKYGIIADIFCLRAYSRALTADEIAHNYSIDKARFNLP